MTSCSSSRVATFLEPQHTVPIAYPKIMVIAIGVDDSTRKSIEQGFAEQLSAMGYLAVSAYSEFGPGGLSGMGEEGTYLKFCDEGVSAILTIARIAENNSVFHKKISGQGSINAFYYNRIWNYKGLAVSIDEKNPIWEIILFDLVTLSPHFAAQIKKQVIAPAGNDEGLASTVLKEMEKVGAVGRQAGGKKGF